MITKMLGVYLLVVITMGVVVAAPETFVRWMEIKKAEPVQQQAMPPNLVLSYKPYATAWEKFKQEHGKSYTLKDEIHSYRMFLQNVAYIERHNQLYVDGKRSFYVGVNFFADMGHEEYRQYNGYRGANNSTSASNVVSASFVMLPGSVDWREKGYVTPVKNQGRCGSCWSFSATGSLEGQHMKQTGKLVSLSEQQLVDCSTSFGNHGCNGGLMDNAFKYVEQTGGIDSEKSYPYLARQENSCFYKKSASAATCTGFKDVPQGSESQLQQATATIGPISIAIDASHRSFQLYSGGVYDDPACSSTQLDHGVLVVGYGTSSDGKDYWIVKNSWTAKWGVEGYIKMSRNKNNQCGVASKASYPIE